MWPIRCPEARARFRARRSERCAPLGARARTQLALILAILAPGLACSGESSSDHSEPTDAVAGEHGHAHHAPRGGHLVEVEPESANLELLVDAETGELVVYLLDAHAERPVRSAREGLLVTLEGEAGQAPLEFELGARANPLSGETVGDSSEYRGRCERLSQSLRVRGRIHELEMRGRLFRDVGFDFTRSDDDAH